MGDVADCEVALRQAYAADVCAGAFGVHPVQWRDCTYFAPWFFTGKIVYWMSPHPSMNRAHQAAKEMAARLHTT